MNRAPAFQLYVKDWLSSARITLMSPAEEGAYIRLLAHCWDSDDCTVPDDDEQLATLSRLGQQWLSYAPGSNPVRSCFEAHPSKAKRLFNKRLYEEWKKLRAFQKERAESGRKGANSRWKPRKPVDSSANSSAIAQPMAQGMAKNGSSSSSSSSILKKKICAASFAEFWRAYPKKRSKGAAEKAWSILRPDAALCTVILTKLDQARRSTDWTKDGGRFIPYPATWLNAKGWEDEYTPTMKERLPL